MPWGSLGTVQPNLLTWQLTDTAALGDLIRVRQTWTGDWPGSGYVAVTAFFPDAGRYGFVKLWPDTEPTIINLPTPAALAAAGYTTRYFAARLDHRARVQASANWSLIFEEYTV